LNFCREFSSGLLLGLVRLFDKPFTRRKATPTDIKRSIIINNVFVDLDKVLVFFGGGD
jgi:hypothetical protein